MAVKHTGISQDYDVKCEVARRLVESRSLDIRRILMTTLHWERAAVDNGVLRKSNSLPGNIDRIEENYFLRAFQRQRSLSESDIARMELDSCSWSIDKEKDMIVLGEGVKTSDSNNSIPKVVEDDYNPKPEEEYDQATGKDEENN